MHVGDLTHEVGCAHQARSLVIVRRQFVAEGDPGVANTV